MRHGEAHRVGDEAQLARPLVQMRGPARILIAVMGGERHARPQRGLDEPTALALLLEGAARLVAVVDDDEAVGVLILNLV